jgi:hydroxymethylglutaryl-coenzyme A reductase
MSVPLGAGTNLRCNECDPTRVQLGGGFRDLEARIVPPFLVLHLIVFVRDATGANAVNAMAETIGPSVAALTGGTPGLFEARVVDILCELTGDCPVDYGASKRQMGLVPTADDVMVWRSRNRKQPSAEPPWT